MNISIAAEKIYEVGPIAITNTMLVTWIVIVILSVLAFFTTRRYTEIPSKLQNFFEMIIEALLSLIDNVTMDRKKAESFLPLVATLFLFIITANWIGLMPGFESIGRFEFLHGERILVPYLRPPGSDLNTTLALAIVTIVSVQIVGLKSMGGSYLKKFFNFANPIAFFVGIIEIVSELSRIISFSFRLFGNVFAGGVLLAVISFFVPFIATIPFYGLEIFVGFVQALVFAMLATVFLQMATISHNEH